MASNTGSQANNKRDREGKDHLASATKPGRDGSESQKAARALDDVDVDVTTDRVELPNNLSAAHGVIKTLHRTCMALKREKKSLEERLNALLLRDNDDPALSFGGFDSDEDVSVARTLLPEYAECLQICALAKKKELWKTWDAQNTIDALHAVVTKLSSDEGDAEQLRVEMSKLVAELRGKLSSAAFVGDDATGWERRGCSSAGEIYDCASRFAIGRHEVREAWFQAFGVPYDCPHAFHALPLDKWCRCRNCVVGFAEHMPRALFRTADGFCEFTFARDVKQHHEQILALGHMRRCCHMYLESGTALDLQMPAPVEMPVENECLARFAHESVVRAAPLQRALEGLRRRFKVLELEEPMSSKIAFGGGAGRVELLVLAGADTVVESTSSICVCDVGRTVMTDCTAAAGNRHEAALLQAHNENAENANVRLWFWIRDSRGVTYYVFDPLTGKLYRRLVRKAGLEKRFPELAPFVKDVPVGDVIPEVLIELSSHTSDDGRAFKIGEGHVRVKSVVKVAASEDRKVRAKIRSGEIAKPPDTYIMQDYDSPRTHVMDYALHFAVVCPSACRYATIDHTLGVRSDNSIGMLRSVSTSENSRIMNMVNAQPGGYPSVQAMYARMFPRPA